MVGTTASTKIKNVTLAIFFSKVKEVLSREVATGIHSEDTSIQMENKTKLNLIFGTQDPHLHLNQMLSLFTTRFFLLEGE